MALLVGVLPSVYVKDVRSGAIRDLTYLYKLVRRTVNPFITEAIGHSNHAFNYRTTVMYTRLTKVDMFNLKAVDIHVDSLTPLLTKAPYIPHSKLSAEINNYYSRNDLTSIPATNCIAIGRQGTSNSGSCIDHDTGLVS